MLTRDLLRVRHQDGRLEPQFLKTTPAIARLAEDLLRHWCEGVGERRQDLEEQSGRICYRGRSLVVGRGLQKLIVDACDFADPASTAELRWRALAASAERLRQGPDASPAEHLAGIETEIGEAEVAERLYADLPHEARLTAAPTWSVAELVARYNRALVQGLVLGAAELEVHIADRDAGLHRRLIKQLRFHRLLAEVRPSDDGTLHLIVSGPGAVLDQAQRYGLQLALFLPAVASAARWRVAAEIAPRGREAGGRLELDQSAPLAGDERFLAYVPEELRSLQERLAKAQAGWRWSTDAPLAPVPGSNELIVPDLVVEAEGRRISCEFFHRWHAAPLVRRLGQLTAGLAPHLVVGIDRSVAKRREIAAALAEADLGDRIFLFSGYPAPRAINRAVQSLLGPPAA